MAKRKRQIIQKFHLIDKDERLLIDANDIEVFNAPNFLILDILKDYFSFH